MTEITPEKPKRMMLVERYTDNNEFSHLEIIDLDTGCAMNAPAVYDAYLEQCRVSAALTSNMDSMQQTNQAMGKKLVAMQEQNKLLVDALRQSNDRLILLRDAKQETIGWQTADKAIVQYMADLNGCIEQSEKALAAAGTGES